MVRSKLFISYDSRFVLRNDNLPIQDFLCLSSDPVVSKAYWPLCELSRRSGTNMRCVRISRPCGSHMPLALEFSDWAQLFAHFIYDVGWGALNNGWVRTSHSLNVARLSLVGHLTRWGHILANKELYPTHVNRTLLK